MGRSLRQKDRANVFCAGSISCAESYAAFFAGALLFCTGFWMSARTGFFQFRKMGYWLRHTIGAIFTNKDVTAHTSKEDMAISQFQSMCTALAGTIGTGNIVGVATAIVSGGPGAIFWMWVMALLGMMTSFAENVLGVYYRRREREGRVVRRRDVLSYRRSGRKARL